MRFHATNLLFVFVLSGFGIAARADTPPSEANFNLLQEMSVSDFRATGLDKLTDAQVKKLGAWFSTYLRQHACSPAAAEVSGTAGASSPAAVKKDVIHSRLAGRFTGWNGWTRFSLENGQIWEQSDHEEMFSTAVVDHPVVTISRGAVNSWYLSVKGFARTVRVHRLKQVSEPR